MSNPSLSQIGPFQVATELKPGAEMQAVIFHGFGANAFDLYQLHEFLAPDMKINWYFPDGPMEVMLGPHMSGRAWLPISESRLQRMALSGEAIRLSGEKPPEELDQVANMAVDFIKGLPLPIEKTVIGGFSQGSMLALDVACRLDTQPLGLALLSSSILDSERWKKLIPQKLSGIPMIQSHGHGDPVLHVEDARTLQLWLRDAGAKVEYLEFKGGHEIPPEVIRKIDQFLRDLAAS